MDEDMEAEVAYDFSWGYLDSNGKRMRFEQTVYVSKHMIFSTAALSFQCDKIAELSNSNSYS